MKNKKYPPETINLHFHSACEMSCKYCFAPFHDCDQLSIHEIKQLVRLLADCPPSHPCDPPRRLNLVGGEPTLAPHFWDLVNCARSVGLRVSIVTNGYSFIRKGVPEDVALLDLVGVSIDSLIPATNKRIGRSVGSSTISEDQWFSIFRDLAQLGVALKINTTVTKWNMHENMSEFIHAASPERWKVFQAFIVAGQNCSKSDDWKVSRSEFDTYVERHLQEDISVCAESEDLMRGSYAMISPDGRFFDSLSGSHHYSESILTVGVDNAWQQIQYDNVLFAKRTQGYGGKVQ